MTSPVLLCADGSDLCASALAAGVALLAPGTPLIVVTVRHDPDPTLITGTGMAGGVLTPDEFDAATLAASDDAMAICAETTAALGIETTAQTQVLQGDPAQAICDFAADRSAAAIIMGTRGRGGIKRAVLGSVSDHVVRSAPCPVIVTGDHALPGHA